MIQTIKKVGKLDGIKSGTKGRSEGAELQTNKKERKSQVEVSLSLSVCLSLSLSTFSHFDMFLLFSHHGHFNTNTFKSTQSNKMLFFQSKYSYINK